MPTTRYLVATLARYVIVEAADEAEANLKGKAALWDLYADVRERAGWAVPITIQTVRPATEDECELWDWHHARVAEESRRTTR
ncbi:MAG TPA: hypothetical protein VM510_03705 [Caulifigura sp.]|jgi:hypothetical protein|nr:hypothetical protein [Caulifigura sp.]